MTLRRKLACIGLGLALLGSACSDDDDSSSSTTSPPPSSETSSSDFVAEASAICAEGSAQIGALFAPMAAGEDLTEEDMQAILDGVVEYSNDQIDQLEALTPPEDQADEWDAMLAEGSAATEEAEAQGLAFFESEDDPWAESNAMAADLGLEACAGDGS